VHGNGAQEDFWDRGVTLTPAPLQLRHSISATRFRALPKFRVRESA
jgi:hypothetical protein